MRRVLKVLGWLALALVGLVVIGWLAFVPRAREPGYRMVAVWGEKGTAPGQFSDPTGIAVTDGEVFVADSRNGRIQVFDRNGRFLRAFGKPGSGAGELGRPMNLEWHNGKLYVPEYFNDRIQIFDPGGASLGLIGRAGRGPGAFNAPGGVGVAADGTLYVADFYNHRIVKLDAQGRPLATWGRAKADKAEERGSGFLTMVREGVGASGGPSFSYPTDVAVAPDGLVYVADGYNDRIQVLAPNGRVLRKWGGPLAMNIHGPFNGWFATVTSIAIGPKGNVFVADFYNHRIQKFAPDGTFLTSFGEKGSGPGQFTYPIAVDVDREGTVYVADFGNNRVSKWRPAGAERTNEGAP